MNNFFGSYGIPNYSNMPNTMANNLHNGQAIPPISQPPMTTSMFSQTTAQQTQQQHQPPQNTLQQSVYNVRPVTSFEEARASAIEFDGKINIFTDFNNGYIYTKSINMTDGNANLQVYKLQPPISTTQQQYITNQDLDMLNSRMLNIEQGLNNLQQDFSKIQTEWGTVNDDKSTNNGFTKQKSNGVSK